MNPRGLLLIAAAMGLFLAPFALRYLEAEPVAPAPEETVADAGTAAECAETADETCAEAPPPVPPREMPGGALFVPARN